MARRELLASIQERYQGSSKRDNGRILGRFIATAGHHRKHGIRLLGRSGASGDHVSGVTGLPSYDEPVQSKVVQDEQVRGQERPESAVRGVVYVPALTIPLVGL